MKLQQTLFTVSWIGMATLGINLPALAIDQVASAEKAPNSDYARAIETKIANAISYPRMAKLRKEEGIVYYAVQINPQGGVSDVAIETSSGIPMLDSEVQDAVRRAAPFPNANDKLTVHGKIRFSLDQIQ